MKTFKAIVFIALSFLLLSTNCQTKATETSDVVINEIAWMGTENSANDEWIEFHNNSETEATLDGWLLKSTDDTPKINLQGKIPAKGFFLLERTDDQTVPNVTADQIYTGALTNSGEKLQLVDNQGRVVDEVGCSAGWFAGNNETKQTMERKDGVGWQTSAEPGGTPKQPNSQLATTASRTPPNSNANQDQEPISEVEPQILAPTLTLKNIFINEILPSPKGPDKENEWIELYNSNGFEVDLSDWQIRDKVGQTVSYLCPIPTKVAPYGFLVVPRTESKIALQNEGDGLELLNPIGEVVHQINYPKAPQGQSYNRTDQGWTWSTILTPEKENNLNSRLSQTRSFGTNKEEESDQTQTAPQVQKIPLAKIDGKTPKIFEHLLTFLIAVVIAIASAIIVLLIKRKTRA